MKENLMALDEVVVGYGVQKHHKLMSEAPPAETTLKAERLTQANRIKKASKTRKNWLEENKP
jgi:hypothetical protein